MFNLRHPFFNPLWRRIAVVVLTAIWGLIELFWAGAYLWATLFLGMSGICAWVFFVNWTDVPENLK